jgi:hypothetical protein
MVTIACAEAAGALFAFAAKSDLLAIDQVRAGASRSIVLAVGQRYSLWLAAGRFVEGNLERIGRVQRLAEPVAAGPLPTSAAAHAAASTEQAFEDVAQVDALAAATAKAFEAVMTIAALRPAKPPPCPPPKPNGPVGLPSASISPRSNRARLSLSESRSYARVTSAKRSAAFGFSGVTIWMEFLGERAIGGLDVLFARGARYSKD